ncbi:MAG: hypothetical protein K6A30_09005 [Lachnospiraceae bacterium]|nr:hypothetical protein [Lachnospiraceae bacterium]
MKKASITVEASIVMWLLALVLGSVMLLFPMIEKQLVNQQLMLESCRDAKKVSAIGEGGTEAFLLGDCYARWGLRSDGGTVLYFTRKDKEEIQVISTFSMPFFIRSLSKMKSMQSVLFREWHGYQRLGEEEEYVYVTKTGEVYHRTKSCRHLLLSIRKVLLPAVSSLRNTDGAKYYPCETCIHGSAPGTVYITSDGNRYHSSKNCRNLLRYIRRIPLSEAKKSYRPCKHCGFEEGD